MFGTYQEQGRERDILRIKGPELPDLPSGQLLTHVEQSADMVVVHAFILGECFKRDEDIEGNRYAWYYVDQYERTIEYLPVPEPDPEENPDSPESGGDDPVVLDRESVPSESE